MTTALDLLDFHVQKVKFYYLYSRCSDYAYDTDIRLMPLSGDTLEEAQTDLTRRLAGTPQLYWAFVVPREALVAPASTFWQEHNRRVGGGVAERSRLNDEAELARYLHLKEKFGGV